MYDALARINAGAAEFGMANALFVETADTLIAVAGMSGVRIRAYDRDAGTLAVVANAGSVSAIGPGVRAVAAVASGAIIDPASRAVHGACTTVCNDHGTDPSVAPWREVAASLGVRASLHVPIVVEHQVGWLLSLYARDKDFFDEEMSELGERVAKTLALAIAAHQMRERARDVSGRLAQAEAMYRNLTRLSSDWIWQTDAEHRFVDTGAHLQVHRREAMHPAVPLGKRRWESTTVDQLTVDWDAHRTQLMARLPLRNFEYRWRADAGQWCWVSVSGDPVYSASGRFTGYRGVARDITARKRAEEQAARMSAMYAALAEVGDVMRQADDRLQAKRLTCEALRRMIGFVHIVIREYDPAKRELTPVAMAGEQLFRSKQVPIPRSRSAQLRGPPSLRAFVGARTVVTHTFQDDPSTRKYWSRAKEVGIASSLSVPLRSAGQVIGELSVYSDECCWFSEPLVELVERTVATLGYGLDALAQREELARALTQLRQSEARYRQLVLTSSDISWEADEENRITYLSSELPGIAGDAFNALLGNTPAQLGMTISGGDGAAQFAPAGKPFRNALVSLETPRGRTWLSVSGDPIRDDEKRFRGYRGTALDVTDRKRAEDQLRQSEERYKRLNAIASDWYWERDGNLLLSYLSPSFCEITGLKTEGIIGTGILDTPPVAWDPEGRSAYLRAFAERTPFRDYEYARLDADGTLRWRSTSGDPIFGANGEFLGYRGVCKDITERKLHEAELLRQAQYDPLTDLPNRALMRDRLTQAIERARDSGQQVAVLLLDLDQFKHVNDSIGHEAGDALLRAIGNRIAPCVRAGDTVARLGGDEFVAIVENVGHDDDVAMVATSILEAVAVPWEYQGAELLQSTSIGISLYPRDGEEPRDLLRNADAAMYAAKLKGRNTLHFYTSELNDRARRFVELRAGLSRAIEREEFLLHYQPIIDLRTGRLAGAEALLRWQARDGRLISPADFIPVAEESGQILAIGKWVLRAACRQACEWRDAGLAVVPLSVNLSPRQFHQGELFALVEQTLRETRLDPQLLKLEITESVMLERPDDVAATLRHLAVLGVHASIDDFGTGYSSLSYLRRLPVADVKVDRAFVRELTSSSEDAMVVDAVIGLAHALGLEVTAEGVETEAQLRLLVEQDCDRIQGYFVSRPVPADEFERFLDPGWAMPL